MRAALFLAATLLAQAPQDPAPLYVPSSVINAASHKAEGLAPNTLATLYGNYLAYDSRALVGEDIRDGVVPTVLPSTGVRVLVNSVAAPILFVSKQQINFLVPSVLLPGNATIQVSLNSRFGSPVRVPLRETAPALFQWDPEFVVATRADGSSVDHARPASPGETIILYATGLGRLRPQPESGQVTSRPARLEKIEEFRVEIDGVVLERESVSYAGAAPGFPGLYQINFKLPQSISENPQIRIAASGVWSQPDARLAVKP